MPLGWERINARRSAPNKNIVFIKPRPGLDEATSKDYLERIAAQCLPIMNKHHLAVVSLEEYEPNLEFWGRNFNNGEVIQLVLKSPSTGRWLPFKFVQMVMMHELAHCKQLNHSKAFWKVRNEYAEDMKGLWAREYTGEGLWGRGVLLENGAFAREELGEGEVLPEHMCGGTFKSRGGKKRKAKPKITYKEAKERRIKKKFGANGVTLGGDDDVKVKLENGKRPAGKPRVAGSARGRELRAAAALARFEVKKEEPAEDDLVTDSETESDVEDKVNIKVEPDDAVDIDGKRLVDSKGHGMVKVCENEDKDDENARQELLELQGMRNSTQKQAGKAPHNEPSQPDAKPSSIIATKSLQNSRQSPMSNIKQEASSEPPITTISVDPSITTKSKATKSSSLPTNDGICQVCSVQNELTALTCFVCSNVLKPDFVVDTWRCNSESCKDGKYINAGDVALCGICGTKRRP